MCSALIVAAGVRVVQFVEFPWVRGVAVWLPTKYSPFWRKHFLAKVYIKSYTTKEIFHLVKTLFSNSQTHKTRHMAFAVPQSRVLQCRKRHQDLMQPKNRLGYEKSWTSQLMIKTETTKDFSNSIVPLVPMHALNWALSMNCWLICKNVIILQ